MLPAAGPGHVDFASFVVTLTPLGARSVAGTGGDACALTSLARRGDSVWRWARRRDNHHDEKASSDRRVKPTTPSKIAELTVGQFAYWKVRWEWTDEAAVLCKSFSASRPLLQYDLIV